MKIRKYDFAYLVEAMRSEQELVSYKGNKCLYPTRMHTTYNLFYFLFVHVPDLDAVVEEI